MSAHERFRPGVHRALAPAKINLGLFVGPIRAVDAQHELASVMQSISLADELTLELADTGAHHADGQPDEVICPGVPDDVENLAAVALRAFRIRTGWQAPPLRLTIAKRIPVAAGLGGGSADAAAALRLATHASWLGDRQLLLEIGAQLGADVPAQIVPGRWLAGGAGEQLDELPPPSSSFGVLVLPSDGELSTAAVYREADRLGCGRSAHKLAELHARLYSAFAHGAPLPAACELLYNDLQRAAVSLCPSIAQALVRVRQLGGDPALVSGSGPTALGLFGHTGHSLDGGLTLAQAAAALLSDRYPAPICAVPVDATFAQAATDTPVRHNSSQSHD
jgi:4-diphosphocytidyl-2-C-methyl-D-erythritol kinase